MKYFVLRSIDLYSTCNSKVPDHFTIGQIVEGEITDNAFICREGDSCKTYPVGNKELDTIFSRIEEEEPESLSLQRLSDKIPSMELRDLFAMNALNGLIAGKNVYSYKEVAKVAYIIADEMLKVRGE